MSEAILIVLALIVSWSCATLAVVLANRTRWWWLMVYALVYLAGALGISVLAVAEIA